MKESLLRKTNTADKSRMNSSGSYAAPGIHMSRKELTTVSSAILTDHPKQKDLIPYEYDNYFYAAEPLELPGNYYFTTKIALTAKNQGKVDFIRKGMKKDE